MTQLDCLNQVAEFHTTFKHPILDSPTIPSTERTDLRVSLLTEELKELESAIKNNDIVEIADALCDLQYVLSGAVLEFGLGSIFSELFDEVHRSNMSKACLTQEDAWNTVQKYAMNDGISSHFVPQDNGTYLVYRSSDNKTLKSVSYSPANLRSILN